MLESQLSVFLMVHQSIKYMKILHLEKILSCAVRYQSIFLWRKQSEATKEFAVSDG